VRRAASNACFVQRQLCSVCGGSDLLCGAVAVGCTGEEAGALPQTWGVGIHGYGCVWAVFSALPFYLHVSDVGCLSVG
jgi:hypothetical protein